MSKISSEYLFHYTKCFEKLSSILSNGFRHNVVNESLAFPSQSDYKLNFPGVIKNEFKFKAVCFCDIPTENAGDHINIYGSYCIAMYKEWGILNKITPIRYIHHNTPDIKNNTFNLSRDIAERNFTTDFKAIEKANRNLKQIGIDKKINSKDLENLPQPASSLLEAYKEMLYEVCNHYYNHFGLMRNYKKREKILYDEREWRSLDKGEKGNLRFRAADIKKIIVKTDEEKNQVLNILKKQKNKLGFTNLEKFKAKIQVGHK